MVDEIQAGEKVEKQISSSATEILQSKTDEKDEAGAAGRAGTQG